jgi:hypothetical protein
MKPSHQFALEKSAQKLSATSGSNTLSTLTTLYNTAVSDGGKSSGRVVVVGKTSTEINGKTAIDVENGLMVALIGDRIMVGKLSAFEGAVDERISTQTALKLW